MMRLEETIDLGDATGHRGRFPCTDDPAYRIMDESGTEIGWMHQRRDHWVVVDFEWEVYGEGTGPRIASRRAETLEEAINYVREQVGTSPRP